MSTEQQHRVSCISVKDPKAYTLIEVMMVLTLMGILAAITVPNLLPFNDRWLLRSTAYMIAGDIRQMQRQSVQECSSYNFELLPGQFWYKLRPNPAGLPDIKKVTLNPRIDQVTSTLEVSSKYGGELSGYRIVSFNYLGNPSNCGSIVLKTRSGSSIKITIEVATGRVLVYD